MAIIYGRAESEKDLLRISPNSVKKIEDLETIHQELKDKLSNNKKNFFNNLPIKIKKEEVKLEKIKNDEKLTLQKYDEKIKNLEHKKAKGSFSMISASVKIAILKNYSKRRDMNEIKDLEQEQKKQVLLWKEKPNEIFDYSEGKTINEIKEFDAVKNSPYHAGAKGELDVIGKLSKLSDEYHVLCGLNIGLPRYVTYNGRKNLRSAQMDFVVVSRKGVILIEVKNWSNQYCNSHRNLNPHEQVDRASRVLWIALQSWRSPKSPRVTSVLLPIQDNMRYDPRYKFVNVSNLDRINYFIENRREDFSDKDVERIVDRLKDHITY